MAFVATSMALQSSDDSEYKIRKVKEKAIHAFLFVCAIFSVIVVAFIILFLFKNAYDLFAQYSMIDFVKGDRWAPTYEPAQLGAWNLIMGSVLVTTGAMTLSIPLSLATAIFISQLAPPKLSGFLKLSIELLSGVPSVVYGFFGLMVLTNWIRIKFDQPTGETLLAGSIILAIMAMPTIITVAEDAISAVGRELREGSLALGATKWQTISRTIVPAALSGITAAVILGMGRAVGETMAVMMVTGNADQLPQPWSNVFTPVKTMTGTLGMEIGEVPYGSIHFHGLFALAIVLFLMVLCINMLARVILRRIAETQIGTGKKKKLFKIPPAVTNVGKHALVGGAGLFLFVLISEWFGYPVGILVLLGIVSFVIINRTLLKQKIQEYLAFGTLSLASLSVVIILGIILFDIVSKGLPVLSWEFLTEVPRDMGREGGIKPAIVGTFLLVLGAIAFALPVGVGAGIYISEYAKEGRVLKIVRAGIDNLNGTPSIVFGLFGFAFFVLYLNMGVSLIAGQLTLGLMVLPTIIRTTEEALKSVPQALREGSLALGASKWQTIWRVVIPPAFPGIITGTILSIGRAGGETAPIMFVAVTYMSRKLPESIFDRVMSLPYMIYILATEVPGGIERGYGVALVLMILVLAMYGTAAIIRQRFVKKTRW